MDGFIWGFGMDKLDKHMWQYTVDELEDICDALLHSDQPRAQVSEKCWRLRQLLIDVYENPRPQVGECE